MPKPEFQARFASPTAALYQAQVLVEALADYNAPKYPKEVIRVSQILSALATSVVDRLTPYARHTDNLSLDQEAVIFDLSRIVQDLYSRLRFLQVADTASCPPGVHTAISLLVSDFVPALLACEQRDVAVLVRPRWSYSPLFVDFYGDLRPIKPASLDPNFTGDLRAFVAEHWKEEIPPPRYVAILSFAGLDRDDVLLYPLLAHEIGHFLDYSYPEHISRNPAVLPTPWVPDRKDLAAQHDKPIDPNDLTLLQYFLELQHKAGRKFLVCLREITADLIATRMLGVAYFFAFAEYFKLVSFAHEPELLDSGYPGLGMRMRLVLEELCDPNGLDALTQLKAMSSNPAINHACSYIEHTRARYSSSSQAAPASKIDNLILKKVNETLPKLRGLLRTKIIPPQQAATISQDLPKLLQLLSARIAPAQQSTTSSAAGAASTNDRGYFAATLAAGWIYELFEGEQKELRYDTPKEQKAEYQRTCNLLIKAMELEEHLRPLPPRRADPRKPTTVVDPITRPARLAAPEIRTRIFNDNVDPLIVVPAPLDKQIQAASLDFHLGHWFRKFKRTSLTHVDLSDSDDRKKVRQQGQAEMYCATGQDFVLHPGDFALGISLQYFGLPSDVMGDVEGKSGLGRTGLIIATAAPVSPGFRGCIVLELCNAGTVPLILRPAMPIAQLVLTHISSRLTPEELYGGQFQCQIKP